MKTLLHRRGVVAISFSALLFAVTVLVSAGEAQLHSTICRNCNVGDCISVPKAEGGCVACICNGLLMTDCALLNCSTGCSQHPTPDGCAECVCREEVVNQNVCPPIPPCPARCQVKQSSGCPRCTCPEEVQCPAVTCPVGCIEVAGPDGCPTCDCPPAGKVCPAMPACPLGCIDKSELAEHAECLACNCTIIEELLAENQIIPEDQIGIELVTDSIDSGIVIPTEYFEPNLRNNTLPSSVITTDVTATGKPSAVILSDVTATGKTSAVATTDVTATGRPSAAITTDVIATARPSAVITTDLTATGRPDIKFTPEDFYVSDFDTTSTSFSPSPTRLGNNVQNLNDENLPVLRIGPDERLTNTRSNDLSRRPSITIPCGETSCPPGCMLCIQSDSCGRCLCGDSARICPPVPACQASCITARASGCLECSCPATETFFPLDSSPFSLGPQLTHGPRIIATHVSGGVESGEVFFERPGDLGIGRVRPSFVDVLARDGGPLINFVGGTQPSSGGVSPGTLAIQNIPPNLLGFSRFQFFTK